jgi:hypothetical protein
MFENKNDLITINVHAFYIIAGSRLPDTDHDILIMFRHVSAVFQEREVSYATARKYRIMLIHSDEIYNRTT